MARPYQATKRREKDPATGKFRWVPIEPVIEPPMPASFVAPEATSTQPVADEPRPVKFTHWYSPYQTNVVLRPSPNTSIEVKDGAVTPRTQDEDDFIRHWLWKQRGKNDPELWHGDTPGLTRDLWCPHCPKVRNIAFRNQDAYEDHIQYHHARENDVDDMRAFRRA